MNNGSYMELCIHLDGKMNVYLRVPTYWDVENKQWIGIFKTPVTMRLIHAVGGDSQELQDAFCIQMKKLMDESDELADEIMSMFRAKEYWEARCCS